MTPDTSRTMARWLRCARAVAQFEALAFTARRLHLSQGALRAELRSIEAAFGVKLFKGPGPEAELRPEAIHLFLKQVGKEGRR